MQGHVGRGHLHTTTLHCVLHSATNLFAVRDELSRLCVNT